MWLVMTGSWVLGIVFVVFIALILVAGIVNIFGHSRAHERAKPRQTRANIMKLGKALELYKMDHGKVVPDQDELKELVNKRYLYDLNDLKDRWGRPYIYTTPGSHGEFDIISYGADGKPGGEGLDVDLVSWELMSDAVRQLYIVNEDGTDRQQLTHFKRQAGFSVVGVWEFAVSPDGSRIAFIGHLQNGTLSRSIYTVKLDGTDLKEIAKGFHSADHLAWSPDGQRFAFSGRVTGSGSPVHFYIIDRDGTNMEKLPNTFHSISKISWGPKGHKIALIGASEGQGSGLYLIELNVGETRRLTGHGKNGLVNDDFLGWSADGLEIVFQRDRDVTDNERLRTRGSTTVEFEYSLFLFDITADYEREWISIGTEPKQDVILSPAGDIYYAEYARGGADLYTINEGAGIKIGKVGAHPILSDDGQKFIFIKREKSKAKDPYGLYLFDMDKNQTEHVTSVGAVLGRFESISNFESFRPQWIPETQKIIFVSNR